MTKLFKTKKKPPHAPLYGKPGNTGNQSNKNVGGSKYGPKISSGFFGLAKGPVTPSYKKARNRLFTNLNNPESSVRAKYNTLKQASGGSGAVNNILSGKRKLGGNNVSSSGMQKLKNTYRRYEQYRGHSGKKLPNLTFEQYVRYSQPNYEPVNMFNNKEYMIFKPEINMHMRKLGKNPYAIAIKIASHSTKNNLPLNANNTMIAQRISNLGYVPTPNVIRALGEYKGRARAENIAKHTSVAVETEVEAVTPMSFTAKPAQPVRQLTTLPPNKSGVVASNQPAAISMQKYNRGSGSESRTLRLEKFGFGNKDNPYLFSQGPAVATNESSA